MSWEKVALGEVTESCLGKMLDQEKNKGEYQPYLANLNVRWGSFDLDNLPEMRFEEHEQERYGLKYGDLIICEGGEPGRCAIWKDQIPNMKIQKALHRVRVNSEIDYRYLFYWFLLAGKNNALDQYFTGATIKHMPGQKLKQVIIDKPPFEVQQRIADILSAYDDLIENNQKQIKLLEEAAQRLYKEWFVDLRFPGYETTSIIDGVPQGWERKRLVDIADVQYGFAFDERYIGDALLQKKYTTDTLPFRKRINRGEKPQYYVENSNPAIIEKASFEAAKALLNERKREYIKNGISHPLSKIIRCPECGKTFRRQIVAGIAYWMCSGHATGKTACQSRRVREDEIYEAFTSMLWKLKDYRQELLGVLINDFERMQSRTSDSQAVIGQIDKEIADLTAQNLVLTKLHNKGILSVTDYNAQAEDLNGKIKELRAKRKKIISEDENDELLSTLRDLNQIIAEYEKSPRFDEELFEQIIESAVMEDNAHITFTLIGGIKLTEEIEHRGRRGTA